MHIWSVFYGRYANAKEKLSSERGDRDVHTGVCNWISGRAVFTIVIIIVSTVKFGRKVKDGGD